MGNPFDAEDLTQDVFLCAYKSLPSFDGTHEKAWLSRIAVHKCLDYLKAAGRRTIPTDDSYFSVLTDSHSSPEEACLLSDSKKQVYLLCQQLNSPYREIAAAHFCDEMTVREIAEKRNQNPRTIQTQLYRAKNMLKKLLCPKDSPKERSG